MMDHNISSAEITEEKANKSRRGLTTALVALLVTALTVLFLFISYQRVQNQIINFGYQNMEVLAYHDSYAVESMVQTYEKMIAGIASELRGMQDSSSEEMMTYLGKRAGSIGGICINLSLVSDDTQVINSNMMDKADDAFYEVCARHDGLFFDHYLENTTITHATGRGESLLLGKKITPITIGEHTYHYLVARLDINEFISELKLESYDSQGNSYVVDQDGYYIIYSRRNTSAQHIDNIFDELKENTFSDGITVEKLREQMRSEEEFSFRSTDPDQNESIVYCTTLAGTEWYFVSVVPVSVFEEQSRSLSLSFLMFMGVILAVILVAGLVVFYGNHKEMKKEQAHRKQLAEALDMAQSANRAKTTFLNNMSHDIRTPMNAIIGYTALAAEHLDDRRRTEDYLGKISKSSQHLLSLINDVLDMSRIESGKVQIEVKQENLADILHTIKDMIMADVRSHQLELFIDVMDVENEEILCDRLRLNQVLLNIISNAVKYTPAGGTISIRVTQKKTAKTGSAEYEFRVKDTGIGMSEEFVKTIFDPFTRARSSTVSGIQGTGLGMAITKNIVDMMNGTILVESEQGKGTEVTTTFIFALPEHVEPLTAIRSLEGLRGLVVDDDMDTCQSGAAMLRQIGMRSEWCVTGKEAVARADEAIRIGDGFHVYILDWLMPDMNGVETARRIRQVAGDNIPIILLSAYDWTDIEEEARAAGVTDFVSKPLFMSDLHRKLSRVCSESEAALSGVPADRTAESVPQESIDFTGRRLLLVEDNELNREIAEEILAEEGFEIEAVEDGTYAVERMKNSVAGEFDAILMDIQMPIMNGYEATRQIRALEDPAIAQIPIIAMTANAFEEDRQAALDAGMNDHVAKPIDVAKLLETLGKLL